MKGFMSLSTLLVAAVVLSGNICAGSRACDTALGACFNQYMRRYLRIPHATFFKMRYNVESFARDVIKASACLDEARAGPSCKGTKTITAVDDIRFLAEYFKDPVRIRNEVWYNNLACSRYTTSETSRLKETYKTCYGYLGGLADSENANQALCAALEKFKSCSLRAMFHFCGVAGKTLIQGLFDFTAEADVRRQFAPQQSQGVYVKCLQEIQLYTRFGYKSMTRIVS